MGWPAVIGTGVALGSMAASAYGASVQNKANKKEAQKQRDFQERMYGSRYQMQVKDLYKAGLNPILAATQGAPGGPSGAKAEMQNVGAAATEGTSKGVSSAIALKLAKAQLANIEMDTYKKNTEGSLADQVNANRRLEYEMLATDLPQAKHRAQIYKGQVGRGINWVKQGTGILKAR